MITVLLKNDMKIDRKIGICFMPSGLAYYFPVNLKEKNVRWTFFIEKKIRDKLTGWGYTIGVSAIKK